jgi:hypothetical protein
MEEQQKEEHQQEVIHEPALSLYTYVLYVLQETISIVKEQTNLQCKQLRLQVSPQKQLN